MAEIEHYVDPLDKVHPRFDEVRDVVLTLLPKDVQMEGKTETTQMTVGEAVAKKIVDNETLGYFLARTQLFLVKIGMDATRVRCRQHMANEMAHYAAVSCRGRGRGRGCGVLPHLSPSPLCDADAYIAYGHSCPVLISRRTAGTLRSNRRTAGSSVSVAPTDQRTTSRSMPPGQRRPSASSRSSTSRAWSRSSYPPLTPRRSV